MHLSKHSCERLTYVHLLVCYLAAKCASHAAINRPGQPGKQFFNIPQHHKHRGRKEVFDVRRKPAQQTVDVDLVDHVHRQCPGTLLHKPIHCSVWIFTRCCCHRSRVQYTLGQFDCALGRPAFSQQRVRKLCTQLWRARGYWNVESVQRSRNFCLSCFCLLLYSSVQ